MSSGPCVSPPLSSTCVCLVSFGKQDLTAGRPGDPHGWTHILLAYRNNQTKDAHLSQSPISIPGKERISLSGNLSLSWNNSLWSKHGVFLLANLDPVPSPALKRACTG